MLTDDTGISTSLSLSLDSFSAFYRWHDAHARPSSADRRPFAQQPFNIAAFMRTCSYTERFVPRDAFHTDAFTHKGVLRKDAFTPEAFRHRRLTQRCFRTARHLRTDALAQTGAFTRRRFYTQKLLHRKAFSKEALPHEALTQSSFTHRRFFTKKFSSPPPLKRQTGI